ncbi:hypothetical protein MKZ24_17830 [Paenibacillus sp. FSL R7-0297]|uniref:hypothetical protein n=1 Tax=unclassified Paenibacillus TaxID=185978 RepID=UPI0012E013E4|nr:hypothetical protein [Paenibacillus sp. FSL R5-0912]
MRTVIKQGIHLLENSNSKVSQLKNLELGIELTFLFEESKGNSQVRSYCSTLMTRISNLIATYSKSIFDNDEYKIGYPSDTLLPSKTWGRTNNSIDLELEF